MTPKGLVSMRCKLTPNQYYLDDDVAELILTDKDGEISGYTIIDADDLGIVLPAGRWALDRGYVRASSGIPLHRLVMGNPDGMIVDHRNHSPLDCRKSNLRVCTVAENSQNKKGARPESQSRIRNVAWIEARRRYRVKVKANGKEHHIGYYRTEEDAVAAAQEARTRLHGDFAS